MNTEKQVDYIVQVVDYHQREQAKQEILALIHQEKQEMIAKFKEIIGEDEKEGEHDHCNVTLDMGGWVCEDHGGWAENYDPNRSLTNILKQELRTKLEKMK